jgi:hypothetical protein
MLEKRYAKMGGLLQNLNGSQIFNFVKQAIIASSNTNEHSIFGGVQVG